MWVCGPREGRDGTGDGEGLTWITWRGGDCLCDFLASRRFWRKGPGLCHPSCVHLSTGAQFIYSKVDTSSGAEDLHLQSSLTSAFSSSASPPNRPDLPDVPPDSCKAPKSREREIKYSLVRSQGFVHVVKYRLRSFVLMHKLFHRQSCDALTELGCVQNHQFGSGDVPA